MKPFTIISLLSAIIILTAGCSGKTDARVEKLEARVKLLEARVAHGEKDALKTIELGNFIYLDIIGIRTNANYHHELLRAHLRAKH